MTARLLAAWQDSDPATSDDIRSLLARCVTTSASARAAADAGLARFVLLSCAPLDPHTHHLAMADTLQPGTWAAFEAAAVGAARPDAHDGALVMLHAAGAGPHAGARALANRHHRLNAPDQDAAVAWACDTHSAALAALPLLTAARRAQVERHWRALGDAAFLTDSPPGDAAAALEQRAAAGRRKHSADLADLARMVQHGAALTSRAWTTLSTTWDLPCALAYTADQITWPDDPERTHHAWQAALSLGGGYTGSTTTFLAGVAALAPPPASSP